MIDMNEIQRRARAARETASANMREAVKKGEALAGRLREKPEEKPATEEAQTATNARRQVEILGQTFSGEDTAQMKASQARMAQIIQEQTVQAASMGAEAVMSQLFGEDMGVIAAALETLAMEESDEEEGTLSREEAEGILWTCPGGKSVLRTDGRRAKRPGSGKLGGGKRDALGTPAMVQ